jgi:hypothetical protein
MKRFTIRTIEDRIRFFKDLAHEPRGKPVPRGVARSVQVMLESLRDEWRKQAEQNKAKKNKRKQQQPRQTVKKPSSGSRG